MAYHDPVMPNECMEGLAIQPNGIYVDATYGGGGHTAAILQQLGERGKLIAFDRDADAHQNRINDPRLTLIRDNFSHMRQHLQSSGLITVNGILADLGVSSHQLDQPERGFSTRFEHDLDMRMDTRSGATALDLLNNLSEKELVQIFSLYGEIHNSKTLAASIVRTRNRQPFSGSGSFLESIAPLIPKENRSQYLARLYQALRIAVNDELGALKVLLQDAAEVLGRGGRLVVISYHSLEDRLVKNFFSKGNFEGEEIKDLFGHTGPKPFSPVNRKPLTPSEQEIRSNPRSRSARLRIAQRN